jgi:hypothetical protein
MNTILCSTLHLEQLPEILLVKRNGLGGTLLYAPVWPKGQVVRIHPSYEEVEIVGVGFGRPAR